MATTTPQDRKTSKADQNAAKETRFEDIEGHELLIPFSKVKGSDQARLTGRLVKLGILSDNEDDAKDIAFEDLDFDAVADLIDYVSATFALDSAAFDAFTCGKGGMERGLNLATAFAGEMGKDEG